MMSQRQRLPQLYCAWRLGALSKAFVSYDRSFWRDDGLLGESVSDQTTVLTFDVSSGADGPGILVVFCEPNGFDASTQGEKATAHSASCPDDVPPRKSQRAFSTG